MKEKGTEFFSRSVVRQMGQVHYKKALKWAELSAKAGNARAQGQLGIMYGTGKGVPQDDAKAVKFLRQAAEQGFHDSQYMLGGLYAQGKGIEKDLKKAEYWWKKAAAQGHEDAKKEVVNLGKYLKAKKQSGGKDIYFAELFDLAEGYRKGDLDSVKKFENLMAKVREDFRHGIAGSIGEQYYLAEGRVLKPDYEAAFYWHTKGAEDGHPISKIRLKEMYESGKGVKKDLKKAQELEAELKSMDLKLTGTGVGFFVNAKQIVVNKHSVHDCAEVTVRFPHTEDWVPATVEAMAKKEDLAVLGTQKTSSKHAVLAAKDTLSEGDTVKLSTFKMDHKRSRLSEPTLHQIAVLNPKKKDTVRRVGTKKFTVLNRIHMTSNDRLGKGDSGSPVIDREGYLVGVASGGRQEFGINTTAMTIPLDSLKSFLKKKNITFHTTPPPSSSKEFIVQVQCERPFL